MVIWLIAYNNSRGLKTHPKVLDFVIVIVPAPQLAEFARDKFAAGLGFFRSEKTWVGTCYNTFYLDYWCRLRCTVSHNLYVTVYVYIYMYTYIHILQNLWTTYAAFTGFKQQTAWAAALSTNSRSVLDSIQTWFLENSGGGVWNLAVTKVNVYGLTMVYGVYNYS